MFTFSVVEVLFDADGALLEVGLARDGVEGSERDEVGVGLGEVKGHEDLAGRDDAGDAQLDVARRVLRRETTVTRS